MIHRCRLNPITPTTTGGGARWNGNAIGSRHASRMSFRQQPTMEASTWIRQVEIDTGISADATTKYVAVDRY